MISVDNITVSYGGWDLFSEVSMLVNPRDRIGLVGKNGAGKTTLLKIINGEQVPTSGVVSMSEGETIGYLPQQMKVADTTTLVEETAKAFSEVIALETEIAAINAELLVRTDYESDSYADLIHRLTDAQDRYLILGGETREADIERTLLGLGFKREEFSKPTREFSGGWRMRIELAKLLLARPSVFLLDEPTNHLDIESIQWLESYLADYPGAVVLISHDRAFLDNVTNRTVEISLGKLYDYKVPYSKYVELRAERRAQQLAAYENQRRMIEKTEEFIEKFRYKPTKSNQVQSRVKQLEKLDRLEVDEEDKSTLAIKFPPAPRSGQIVAEVKGVGKSFPVRGSSAVAGEAVVGEAVAGEVVVGGTVAGETIVGEAVVGGTVAGEATIDAGVSAVVGELKPAGKLAEKPLEKRIFSGADFAIERGEKIALVGRNGEGKTTFARMLVGELEPSEGTIRVGANVNTGYYAQNQDDLMDGNFTVFDTLDRVAVGDIRTRLRDILGAFLFRGGDIDKKVKVLSGGERSRLAMARLMLEPYNLLILDEPTNHMDMRSKDILKRALLRYDGTVVVISHDREFLDGLVDKVYEFRDGGVREYIGDIWYFLEKRKLESLAEVERKAAVKSVPEATTVPVSKSAAGKSAGAGSSAKSAGGGTAAGAKSTGTASVSAKSAPVSAPVKSSGKDDYLRRKETEKARRRLEGAISAVEAHISELEAQLAVNQDYNEYPELQRQLAHQMHEWEKLNYELELVND